MTPRLLLFVMTLGLTPTMLPAVEPSEPLKVLFLGDDGHHRPSDRAAQLIPVMAGRGIEITYTNDQFVLNRESLASYDALLVYANIEEITPEQEQALLDYVAEGGGFVPVHCASFCFLNSPEYIALVGAQFLRHGAGEFDTTVVDGEHPITNALEPFRTWDETYVHHHHNEDRHVLQVRADEEGEEPWTWVREHGKGRVFYTAYGHDERTWGHPGFHDLIERGIRWASNRGEVFDSRPRVPEGLEPFEYEEAEADIPNYLADQRWGTQGDPSRQMQSPLEPEESMRHAVVPPGFELRLFAAEPDIVKPICMAWDHRGRLWIVESIDYPNTKLDDDQGRDRIKICEDTNGDGRADRFTVFADGLNIPTSLTFAHGGVIVHQAPDTLFLKDTTGDDRADVREVLFNGWGTDDTHAGPSNLRYGLDNWVYGIVGYSAFRGSVGTDRHRFGQGFYRFRPDGSELEFLRSTNNNSWGVGISEEGLIFGSTANGCPSVYLSIPNRYYEAVRGWSPSVLRNIADSNRFFPITDRVRQVDWHGGFTAAAGHALYTARTYPEHYWNSTAFVAEPTGHLVATFTLHPRGSDFVAHNAWNQFASQDEWSAPIVAEVGPDGHVWVIDWYNYIVQHNPTPHGFETGKGNAYVTPLRDKTHGRIYRVVYKGAEPSEPFALDPDDGPALVSALSHDNQFWRLHAQRLLIERGESDVTPALIELVGNDSVDSIGLNAGATHALWVLHGLGQLDGSNAEVTEAAVAALGHPSAGVRRNALLVLPREPESSERVLAADLLADDAPQVRLAALLTLSELPRSQEAADAIVSTLLEGAITRDRWLLDAATSAAAAHDREFLIALANRGEGRAVNDRVLAVAGRVAEHFARGTPADTVASLLEPLAESDTRLAEAIVNGLAQGWPEGAEARLNDESEAALVRLVERLPLASKGPLVLLAQRWGSERLEQYAAEVADTLLAQVRDESQDDADRVEVAHRLIVFRRSDDAIVQVLLDQITPRTTPELATGLIEAVGRSDAPEAGQALMDSLAVLTPAVRPVVLRTLLGRAEWTKTLMDAIEAGEIRLTELSLDQRQALAEHPDRSIAARATQLLEGGGGLPDANRQKVIDELAPVVMRGGDPARGQLVFREECAKCHMHSGEGTTIGPDLTGMAAHPREELLIHILDPSRSVEGNYVQYNVATVDGRVFSGLLASETRTSIELLDAENQRHAILREDIDELLASTKSLMPDGFEQIGPEQLADLLAFLTDRGEYLPLDLRQVATAVSTKGMFNSEDSRAERLVFSDWSPKTFEGVPFLLVDPQGDRVPNAILLNGPQGSIPPTMPRSVSVPCNVPARAIHLLSGVSGWGYPLGEEGSVSMIVRLHYSDGQAEDHPLQNGVHFADYIRPIEVPESTLAFQLRGRQLRYLAVHPKRSEPIERIEFVKGTDATAPIVMAVTVEVNE